MQSRKQYIKEVFNAEGRDLGNGMYMGVSVLSALGFCNRAR
jgi:hypothetical protein